MTTAAGGNFWQGRRVLLRAVEPADAEHFLRWNQDSDRGRHLDFLWPPISESSLRAWVAEQAQKRLGENDAYQWMMVAPNGETVGSIVTHSCSHRDGTFSYALDVAAEHRRKGYASEAIVLVLRYYFHELRYQKCNVAVHGNNPASVALHTRLGFLLEGTQRRSVFNHGVYSDGLWFGLTREEFEARF
jgi:RimJ/RimL family protein N-acetyltransferase